LKSVALPIPKIIGVTPKNWEVQDTLMIPFLQNFNFYWAFARISLSTWAAQLTPLVTLILTFFDESALHHR